MMVMRRRQGERILIGDNITIHIAHIGRNKVKIAIQAPREIPIVAEEVMIVRDDLSEHPNPANSEQLKTGQ